jgi:hypothetical protein
VTKLAGDTQSRQKWSLVVVLAALSVAIWIFVLVSGLGFHAFGLSWDFKTTAEFGDSFGPLNTLLAFIAAVSAYWVYRSQEEELQRLKSAEKTDRIAAYKRDFEHTFFQLLDLLRQTVNEITVKEQFSPNYVTGRRAFSAILEEVGNSSGSDAFDEEQFRRVYQIRQAQLGHYFRLIYQILRFVDESEIADKKFYTRLLRATFSNDEIVLIGLNGWHGGYKKTKRYIEEYSLLNNITATEATSRRMTAFYDQGAFGSRDFDKERNLGVSATD